MFGKSREKPAIRSIIFEVTEACNLDCRYCYNIWKMPGGRRPEQDSYSRASRVLRRLFRQVRARHVTFTGGEPLRFERLPELVLLCRMKGAGITVITNGTVGQRDDYARLVDLGVGLFELPVLAPEPALHDDLVRQEGAWERVRRSIEELRGMGAGLVVVVVASKANLPVLRETLEYIADLGVSRVMLNRFNIGGTGIDQSQTLWLEPGEVREMFEVGARAIDDLGLRITTGVCTPMCLIDPKEHPKMRPVSCSRDPRRRPMTLDCHGNVRACNHSPVVLGNIHDLPLLEIFAGDSMLEWTRRVPDMCKDCERWEACLGGCRAAAEQLGGSLEDPDPLLWPKRREGAQRWARG